jgi:serine/threonine protein kinase
VIGETFGNFRVVSRIGRGGMGEVYLAEQLSIGTRVAIKLLQADISEDKDHVQRFFNEARAVSRIQHAGIVKIFDVGFHGQTGQAYLVMEYLDGESLAQRIGRGRLSPAQVTDVGRQIASVLEATHAAGITHRDLKPDNIFLVPDRELASRERVKVLDFGIAKLTGTLAGASPRTSGTMGTPAYMAPEQWGDSSKVDWRADLYALGCLTFEMVTGRPPFECKTFAEACAQHLTSPPPSAQAIEPSCPGELNRLLLRLLAKDPNDRPQTAQDVVHAFDAIARDVGSPIVSGPTAMSPKPTGTESTVQSASRQKPRDDDAIAMTAAKKRSLALPIGLGVVAVAAIAGVSGYFLRDSKPDKPTAIVTPAPDAAIVAVSDAAITPDAVERGLTGEQEYAFDSLLEHTKKQFETCYVKHKIKTSNDVLFIVEADANGAAKQITLEDAPPAAADCLREIAMGLAYPKTASGFEHSYWQRIDAPKAKRPEPEPAPADPAATLRYRTTVLRQLKTLRPAFRNCLTGTESHFSLVITFRDDGGVKRVEFDPVTVGGVSPQTQRCLGDVLAKQTFASPPAGISRTLTIPFAFPGRLRRD